jgi:tRNA dimethylallyltransferase
MAVPRRRRRNKDSMTRCVIVTGPTASGKTRLAVALARRFGGEIVSADSRQVYRGMDIGTGKDMEEYSGPDGTVPCHLIDVVAADEEFHLFRYLELAGDAIAAIAQRGRLPIVAGGTVLYLKALLDGYHQEGGAPDPAFRAELAPLSLPELIERLRREAPPDLYARTDLTQPRRVIRALELARNSQIVKAKPLVTEPLILAPFYPRAEIRARIARRLDERLDGGLLEEVQRLYDSGLSWERLDWFGLEYRYVAKHLRGELSRSEMREELLCRIRQFAKSQDIWFRKLERSGHVIHWLREGNCEQASALVNDWLAGRPLPPPELRLEDIRYGPKS